MNSSEYQVTIKSANQKVDDYMTKCRPGWTVLQLKQHISETHINKPRVEDQRLIYAGNLLQDTHTLKQIFFRDSLCTELTNSSKTDFTIHLVCYSHAHRSSGNTSSAVGQASSSSRPSSTTNSSSTSAANLTQTGLNRARPTTSVWNRTTSNNQQTPVTRPAPQTSSLNNQNILSASQAPPTLVTPSISAAQQSEMIQNLMQSDQMRQQMALFQQLAYMVAAQIATNLTNSSNNTNNNDTSPINLSSSEMFSSHLHMPVIAGQTLNVRITNSPIASAASQLLYADNRQQAPIVQADARETVAGSVHQNQNVNNENNTNAAGVQEPAGAQYGFGGQMQNVPPVLEQPAPQPEQVAPMMQHDVIDWVYYSIRAAVLMVALYLNASMFRLLFIVGLLAIAYFFNRRRVLPTNRHDVAQPQQAQQFPPVGDQQLNQENGELRRRNVGPGDQPIPGDNGNNDADETARDRAQEELGPARLPFLKLCYLVVTDFLASLVPE